MSVDVIVKKFREKPSYIVTGAGKLNSLFGWKVEDVKAARLVLKQDKAREAVKNEPLLNNPKYIGSEQYDEGCIKKYESSTPLTPLQLKKLVGVDDKTSFITRILDRLLPSGKWVYSVSIALAKKERSITDQEMKESLKALFPNIKAQTLPIVKSNQEKALVILISDDHAGSDNSDSMANLSWDIRMYRKRLLKISNEVKLLGIKFEEVHILSLGDQLNGWNAQTTRGGHEVKSTSNKDQFDMYTSAKVGFYNDLFSSGVSKQYYIHDVENSNHSGNSFSYVANRYLSLYLEFKFPQVVQTSYFNAIDHFTYGDHIIGFTHGKDEKLMKRPMPLKLDPKTDLFLFQYFDNRSISPSGKRVTFYKGDLHSYAVDKGKFGRYVNVPSIMGATAWTEINFGSCDPGAVLEIYNKTGPNVTHLPIWF